MKGICSCSAACRQQVKSSAVLVLLLWQCCASTAESVQLLGLRRTLRMSFRVDNGNSRSPALPFLPVGGNLGVQLHRRCQRHLCALIRLLFSFIVLYDQQPCRRF